MCKKPRCNKVMYIGDDFGDNSATIRCQLPKKHSGPHQESYTDESFGHVTIQFEHGDTQTMVDMARLKHIIPAGHECANEHGKCGFLSVSGSGDNVEYGCYLSSASKPIDLWSLHCKECTYRY